MPDAPAPAPVRSAGFLLIVALAYAGGTVGYLPLLSLLLPIKVEVLAGDARIGVLAAATICGAVAASLSNILFGWLSDRSRMAGRGRRGWLAAGIVATALSYGVIAAARDAAQLVVAVVLFQGALNMLLAPLVAIMADEIPDTQKGVVGGLLAFANPLASAVAAGVIGVAAIGENTRLACVAAATVACVLPLVFVRADPLLAAGRPRAEAQLLRRDLAAAWAARLLVQVAGNMLSLYLLYYFESVSTGAAPAVLASDVSRILTIAFIVPLPVALLLGRVSDRMERRKPILLGAAGVAALGLLAMAAARSQAAGAIGFGTYAVGSQVFLVLHAAFAMQLLPDPAHRGRDLGILNLANTLPALLGLALAWALATPRDFAPLMLMLAGLTACGGGAVLAIHGRR